MTTDDFIRIAKKLVYKTVMCSEEYKAKVDDWLSDWTDVFTVWQCKTLQNHKGVFSIPGRNIGVSFEITYNGDKDELYVDAYKKVSNVCICHPSNLEWDGEFNMSEDWRG